MIKIMTVDDEPFFISDFRDTIESIGGDYQVICEAYDAHDALQKIPVYKPDIIFIDIKLPGVDGITLLRKVKELHAYVIPIILSGYPDFSLAREALRAEADDYLVKPIDKQQLSSVLQNKSEKLRALRRKTQLELLASCLKNTDVSNEDLEIHFPYPCYYLFMITGNSLDLYEKKIAEIAASFLAGAESYWLIEQAAEDSLLILFGLNRSNGTVLKKIATNFLSCCSLRNNIFSIVISDQLFDLRSLSSVVEKMKTEKNLKLVLGQPLLTLFEDQPDSVKKDVYDLLQREFEAKLHTALWTHHWDHFRKLLKEALKASQEKKLPKIFIKKYLLRLIIEVEKNYPLRPEFIGLNTESNIERIVEKAADYEILAFEYLDFLEKAFDVNDVNDLNDDQKLMSLIENYLTENITQNLSVNKICKHFRISQPKMNRIIRKYKEMSFVTYFTLLKIEKAKTILLEQPHMPINNLAYMLGFSDNLYFSKVFKKMTSYTPTQYRALHHSENNSSQE